MSSPTRVILSAGATGDERAEEVRRAAARRGARIVVATRDDPPGELARTARDEGCERIISAGGDGTLHQIVNGLAPRLGDIDLAILPLGTGNDLARSLGIDPACIDDHIALAFDGSTTPIDVMRVGFHGDRDDLFAVNAISAGFGGEVNARLDREAKGRWGALSYWIAGEAQLADMTVYEVHLGFDDVEEAVDGYGLAIGNGRFVAGGVPAAPKALLDDGLLDLVIAPVQSFLDRLATAIDFSFGHHGETDRVLTRKVSRVSVRATPRMPISIDGELVGRLDAELEIVPGALPMVVAEDAPAISTPTASREPVR